MTDELALFGGTAVRTRAFPAWPQATDRDVAAVTRALRSGNWGGDLEETTTFAAAFAARHDNAYGVCCLTGSEANRISMRAAGLKPGEEVIVPALTWVSTAVQVTTNGADPVVVDIDESTHLMDLALLEEALSPKTAGIVSVHYTGRVVPPEPILDFANRHGLFYVEDCAQAHGGRWLDKSVGSYGSAASFSFQWSKILTGGEGGIVITSDPEIAASAHAMVDNNRQKPWFKHEIRFPEVTNSRLTELQGALLSSQLEYLDERHATRERNAARLHDFIDSIDGVSSLRPDARETAAAYWRFVLLLGPELQELSKDVFIRALIAEGIPADPGHLPVHVSPLTRLSRSNWRLVSREEGSRASRLPVVEHLAKAVHVWLPHNLLLGDERDMSDIATAIAKVRNGLLGQDRREATELSRSLPAWYDWEETELESLPV